MPWMSLECRGRLRTSVVADGRDDVSRFCKDKPGKGRGALAHSKNAETTLLHTLRNPEA